MKILKIANVNMHIKNLFNYFERKLREEKYSKQTPKINRKLLMTIAKTNFEFKFTKITLKIKLGKRNK